MREWIDLCESKREISPELLNWVTRWVESSHQIEDQIELFDRVRDEASRILNVSYPVIYRGLSISDQDLDELSNGNTVTIPAHRLQSWSKSRSIASDYALPGHGGDTGVLVRKTGRRVAVVADIENIVRRVSTNAFSWNVRTDISREREVIVQTDGTLAISPNEVLHFSV
jgi:hypothetical protein